MKTYEGIREGHSTFVTVNGRPLDPRLDLWNHSPSGFEWGYAGSGPAQLALALLADHFGNDDRALIHYHEFKHAVVARLCKRGWTLTSADIEQHLETLKGGSHGRALHNLQ